MNEYNAQDEYRSLAALGSDVEVRSAGDGRTLAGIAVPWDKPTYIDNRIGEEAFSPGAFRAQVRSAGRIPLAREHLPLGGALIGKVTLLRDDKAGLYFEARISPTATGDETLALIQDGALDAVSIGFREKQNKKIGKTTYRTSAHMTELAVVMAPAYSDARVLETRSADEEADGCPHCYGVLIGAQIDAETRSRAEQANLLIASLPLLPPMPRSR